MSHVVLIEDLDVTDLTALATAASMLGLELVRDQQAYKWYGRFVGDHPMPAGFEAQDLGRCEHVLRIPNDARAYEIGVVRRKDGKPGYTLLYDFYGPGRALKDRIGADGGLLKQAYASAVTISQLTRQGMHVTTTTTESGAMVLTATGGRGGAL